jgi:hypothetical protein
MIIELNGVSLSQQEHIMVISTARARENVLLLILFLYSLSLILYWRAGVLQVLVI